MRREVFGDRNESAVMPYVRTVLADSDSNVGALVSAEISRQFEEF